MRGSVRGSVLRMLLAYFAGAISMFIFLVPGPRSIGDILDQSKKADMVNFDQAATNVEKVNDLAILYACKAKDYVKEQWEKDQTETQ